MEQEDMHGKGMGDGGRRYAPLWMKHIWRREARELNATEGGPQAPYGHQQQG